MKQTVVCTVSEKAWFVFPANPLSIHDLANFFLIQQRNSILSNGISNSIELHTL